MYALPSHHTHRNRKSLSAITTPVCYAASSHLPVGIWSRLSANFSKNTDLPQSPSAIMPHIPEPVCLNLSDTTKSKHSTKQAKNQCRCLGGKEKDSDTIAGFKQCT